MKILLEKLQSMEQRYAELSAQLTDPALFQDPERLRVAAKQHTDLKLVLDKYQRYKRTKEELESTRALLGEETDEELLELAREEQASLEADLEEQLGALKLALLPKDPNDERGVVLEIRAGTGGDEATLFAQELFRMYVRYAESRRWKVDIVSTTLSAVGGFKEVTATVDGSGAYSRLKYESGVHRVQRVPETEAQGRVHTSAVTVAVLPEADEVAVKIAPAELRIDRYCSSGPGGQSVNTTYSAVRITHLPTGEVVTCQDEKSQIKNKAKALKVLRSRLLEKARLEQQTEIAESRRAMVGSGDRSEKIRTYNFPQNRVTDHRLNLTLHRLEAVLQGGLDELIDQLVTAKQAEELEQQTIN